MATLHDLHFLNFDSIGKGTKKATPADIQQLFAVVAALIDKVDGPGTAALVQQLQKGFTQPKTPGSPHP